MNKDDKDIVRGNTISLLHFSQRVHERFPDLIDYYSQLPSSGYSIYQLTDVLTMNNKNINNTKLSDLTIPAKDYYWPWMSIPTASAEKKMVKLRNSRDDLEERLEDIEYPNKDFWMRKLNQCYFGGVSVKLKYNVISMMTKRLN